MVCIHIDVTLPVSFPFSPTPLGDTFFVSLTYIDERPSAATKTIQKDKGPRISRIRADAQIDPRRVYPRVSAKSAVLHSIHRPKNLRGTQRSKVLSGEIIWFRPKPGLRNPRAIKCLSLSCRSCNHESQRAPPGQIAQPES